MILFIAGVAVALLALAWVLRRQDPKHAALADFGFEHPVEDTLKHLPILLAAAARAGPDGIVRADVRPVIRADRRPAVAVELSGATVGYLTPASAGRYRARYGMAITSCRARIIPPHRHAPVEMWLDVYL